MFASLQPDFQHLGQVQNPSKGMESTAVKIWVYSGCGCTLSVLALGRTDKWIPVSCWPISLAHLDKFQANETLEKNTWEVFF